MRGPEGGTVTLRERAGSWLAGLHVVKPKTRAGYEPHPLRCLRRRMEGAWNHDRPYYRCQIHREDPRGDHPSTIYMKEDALLPGLDGWLAELFDTEHLDDTCQALAKASQPDEEEQSRTEEVRRRIVKLDGELDAYRTVVRNEPDAAATVGRWIAATTQERRRLETVHRGRSTTRLTKEDIKALVESLRDITATLAEADPADKGRGLRRDGN